MVKYCKKKCQSHDASHDALFIVCRCKNSSDDCQPGLKTKIYPFIMTYSDFLNNPFSFCNHVVYLLHEDGSKLICNEI